MSATLLLAQMQELFLAIAFIFLALWFVLKVATERVRQQRPGPRPPQRPPMRPEARPAPFERPAPASRDPREEVAEFLRRAQMRRGNKPATPVKPSPALKKPNRTESAKPGATRRSQSAPQRKTGTPSSASPPPLPNPPAHELVEVTSITSLVAPVREEQSAIQKVYDPYAQEGATTFSVKPIDPNDITASAEGATPVPTTASSLADLLMNPSKIRDAIILNEILQPPSQRWE